MHYITIQGFFAIKSVKDRHVSALRGSSLGVYINICIKRKKINIGMLISPQPDQEGNKLQRQKILSFIYPIYNRNWRNISTIFIYNKTSIKRIILTIKKIHREVGRQKKEMKTMLKYLDVGAVDTYLPVHTTSHSYLITHSMEQSPS